MPKEVKTEESKGLQLSLKDVEVLYKALRKAEISRDESDVVYSKIYNFLEAHE